MSVFGPDSNYYTLGDGNLQVKTVAIGLLAESEFEQARASISDLADHRNYGDWLDSREGQQIGLSMAGVNAATVCVSLSSFLEWRGLTGASSDERALDAFAALALIVRNSPASKALAVVSEFDFATHSLEVAAFAGRRDYQDWARHRREIRAKAVAAGLRVVELPVRVGGFVEWCACVRQEACEAALDCYAELLLEFLTSDVSGSD
ncbi:MAG: hypothetical protein ABR863_05550 [Roseiarcus sp.]|jgi:hypothetical protein